ncbi:two-component system, chemotaxis family, CheB/CheR fusion protein [Trichlorobacter thiogenes]|uniref:Two-component system, chemotaxis family, CheB/CheR fusion protein n=1 Tax=Trichlorobacter thiogenes TaxID=115783 RepID=A0A1T4NY08_9BACT|nr:chemotaxis protein CheB [Trichlorobacter thiogenes]SJZ83937.1 two-component system, chemotaxis family, CheB/CheR fusion protein [Trichlorobacter thiogenes]
MKKNAPAPPIVPASAPTAIHYVGIGASAGGLEAIESFFTNMPPDSGMAFIVVQHLSPDYKSLMVELLSKKTAMPVHRAEDAMEVLPNHVYLIPPKKNLTIFHGKLLLSDQDHSRGINLPIDLFLRSLADDQAEHAVAIILSGTGSDGMRGVRAVKENGGMVMVQSEESAKFDGMPRSAISTGLADFVLPPDQMPKQLQAFIKHPYVTKSERSESLLSDEDGLLRIFALLRERCKVDFTYYKPSTVVRRIERRMSINQVEDIKDYVNYILSNPSELTTLYRELLIGVTSFFRDQEAFDFLATNILPDLFRNATSREIRFWVAACSTGEEAYSLAILARECLEKLGSSHDIKIFATDIDRDAIHFAAAGSYPESIAADLSPRILSKYFHKRDDNFQIARTIREMVVFAQHNLIKDPPFTNIDLISCRNVLIYFQPILQRKVFEFFNFSLAANGALFLGSSESTGEMSSYFDVLDQKLKIFRSKGRLKPLSDTHLPSVPDSRFHEMKGQFAIARRAVRATEEERVMERFIEAASADYIPLALVVNEQLEVQHIFGDATGYLKLPSGKVVNDISKMAVKGLAIPVATGIQKVFRQRQELRFSNIRVSQPDGSRLIDMRIKLLPAKKEQDDLVAVFITETKKTDASDAVHPVQTYDLSKEAEDRMRDLEHELQFTRENLQATIEELETSNEELQATNEELLASNEELQSTNEELQSTNEELFTVNAEYQSKIIELTELHNDLDNLLSATQIGNLLLDENMEVRRFSKRVCDIFKLLDSDIGRSITHITHHLLNCDPISLIRDVQYSLKPQEFEVQTQDGRWRLMRIVPYAIGPKTFSGTVVSFVDINSLKQAQKSASEIQQLFADVVHSSPALVWLADTSKGCTWFNEPWLAFTGRTMEQELGNGWAEGVHPDDRDRCFKIYTESFDQLKPFSMEYRLRRHDGVYRLLLDEGRPRFRQDGSFAGYIGACLDISDKTCPFDQPNCVMHAVRSGALT